ncbi:MAG: hypothetical protein ACKVY0_29570 [Prosthecobacter sp.]|uniref:hypothetical protein n=1 Tax=Prosthecobacter sp. TaxID=1965333 RepID=UPI00390069E3
MPEQMNVKSDIQRAVSKIMLAAIGGAVLGAIGGAAYWFVTPGVYRSSAILEVSALEFRSEGIAETRENILSMPYKSDAVTASFQNYLLTSRVSAKLGGKYSEPFLRNCIKAKAQSASLVAVSAQAGTGREAQQILQTVVDERLALEKERYVQTMKPLLDGVDSQLAELRHSIEAHYKQIADYSGNKPDLEEKRISGIGQAGFQASIAQLAGQVEDARVKLGTLNAAIVEAEKGNATSEGIQDFGEASYSFSDLKRQLASKAATLASLRSRYGDKNPAVDAAVAELDETKRFLIQALRELAHQVETKLNGLVAAQKALGENSETLKQQTMTLLDRDPTYNTLVTAKASLVASYQQMLIKKHELAVTSRMQPLAVQVLGVPDLPTAPYTTSKLAVAGAAIMGGMLLGACVAVWRSGILFRLFAIHDEV